MFRLVWRMWAFSRGFPHTRGDVPELARKGESVRGFSPHAWGCSVLQTAANRNLPVFPTRVGMFLSRTDVPRLSSRFPHTRGDVPWSCKKKGGKSEFSPHAWGCSGQQSDQNLTCWVFPTRVGMFRACARAWPPRRSFPHTRGDVPWRVTVSGKPFSFSPHAWGCSVVQLHMGAARRVFPTRVGMFRQYNFWSLCRSRFPHTRGDVPLARAMIGRAGKFSPHAWGCSDVRRTGARQGVVFPTRVGMFLGFERPCVKCVRFPHTRGDVPSAQPKPETPKPFSPHAWGCSWCVLVISILLRGFPHTRGDVPGNHQVFHSRHQFSPHAWGCSVVDDVLRLYPLVFPTRVGMFRWTVLRPPT